MKKTLSLLMLLYLCGIMAQTKSRVENPPIQKHGFGAIFLWRTRIIFYWFSY